MKRVLAITFLVSSLSAFAGNPDRRGESGANELNINPYARTAGLWALNVARVRGLEAERLNPAGLGYARKIEAAVNYTSWMTGAGVNIIQGGYAQKIKNHSLALSINSVNFNPIEVTTTENPNGGLGTYRPNFINIGLSYAINFDLGNNDVTGSNILTGGATFRYVNETVTSVSANGFAVDLGVMYTTGKKENIHFGVSLRNLGTPMTFKGEALYANTTALTNNGAYNLSYSRVTQKFEMPIQLNLGVAYDVLFGEKINPSEGVYYHNYRLTPMFQFEGNAFGNDNYGLGMEFSFKEMLALRAGYRFQNGIFKESTRLTAYNGFSAGVSVEVPFKKDRSGMSLGIDYGYRMTGMNTHFMGTHTAGIRFNFGGPDKPKELKEDADSKASSGTSSSSSTTTKKSGKKAKITQEEFDATQQKLADLEKANQELKIKAETPIVKIDTVVKEVEKVVVKVDTVVINNSSVVKTEVVKQGGKTIVKFTDTRPIMFKTGSSEFANSTTAAYLDEVAKMMKSDYPSSVLMLSGHTDNVGDPAKNKALSQARVDKVKAELVKRGVAAERIPNPMGYGSERPLMSNDTPEGRAANRRVELQLEN